MRIPLSEVQKGYFYPIGKNYVYFVATYLPSAENHKSKAYRYGTWVEFKSLYPKTIGFSEKFRYKIPIN